VLVCFLSCQSIKILSRQPWGADAVCRVVVLYSVAQRKMRSEKIFYGILFCIAVSSSALFTFAVIGISITPSGLKKAPWIEGKSDGTIMAVGRIYGGTNAIFIEGDDSDVLKYVDCKDMFDFCQSCGSISSTTTFLLSLTLLSSFLSIIFCSVAIFASPNDHRISLFSMATSLFGLFVYILFHHCFVGFVRSDGLIARSTREGDGLRCLLSGLILSALICVFSSTVKILESNGMVSFRSSTVYLTTGPVTEIRVRSRDHQEQV
jgi:hypothetical protein